MIYITETYDKETGVPYIKNVWDVPTREAKEFYEQFIKEQAENRGVVIYAHYGGKGNPKNFHMMEIQHQNKLTIEEFKLKSKEWTKFLRQWNFDKFVNEKLKGVKLNFKIV